jgi:hypothetical protein
VSEVWQITSWGRGPRGEQSLPEGASVDSALKGETGPFGDYISMGGLVTIMKVRDRLTSYDEDPGWYQHPPGTVAVRATEAELARDGIDVNERSGNGEPFRSPPAAGPAERTAPGDAHRH